VHRANLVVVHRVNLGVAHLRKLVVVHLCKLVVELSASPPRANQDGTAA
jgi:hypothetical protein